MDMAIARLRRLLECEEAIVTTEGRLQLSLIHVWTDIRPLLHAISSAQLRRDELAAGNRLASRDAVASISAVLENYGGPFLADELHLVVPFPLPHDVWLRLHLLLLKPIYLS